MGRNKKSSTIQAPGAYHPDHESYEDHLHAVKKALRLKLKTNIGDLNNDALKAYAKAAKALSFKVNLLLDMDDLIATNLGYLYKSTDDEYPPSYTEEYWEVTRNMPGRFHSLLVSIVQWHVKGSEAAGLFLTMLKDHCDSGRSDVVGCIKRYVVAYLPKKRGQAIVPELVSDSDKTLRGFNNSAFGEMIVGIRHRAAYRKNPGKYCQQVKNGEIEHVPTSLPSFLFHEDIVYDPRFPEKGLGDGYLFIRVLRAVLTTPSSAYGETPVGKKSSRAYEWRLTNVPGKVAAAIAALTYIGLSDMREFGFSHGNYSVAVLYTSLCQLFINSSSKALMANITRSLPHLKNGPKTKAQQYDEEKMLSYNPLEDIIRSREAALDTRTAQNTTRDPRYSSNNDNNHEEDERGEDINDGQDQPTSDEDHDQLDGDNDQLDGDNDQLDRVDNQRDSDNEPEDFFEPVSNGRHHKRNEKKHHRQGNMDLQDENDEDFHSALSYSQTLRKRSRQMIVSGSEDENDADNHSEASGQSHGQTRYTQSHLVDRPFRLILPPNHSEKHVMNAEADKSAAVPPVKKLKKIKQVQRPTAIRVLRPRTGTVRGSVPPADTS